jgi:hypothetical protein
MKGFAPFANALARGFAIPEIMEDGEPGHPCNTYTTGNEERSSLPRGGVQTQTSRIGKSTSGLEIFKWVRVPGVVADTGVGFMSVGRDRRAATITKACQICFLSTQ